MPPKRKLAKSVAATAKKTKRCSSPLPVTLLSGFLGSGKTTLLQHILKSDHGLRIAVIVNDIGQVNVDASLIKSTHRITKTEEKVIALQNGCICCTLRQDLLSELVELSEKHSFDYVVIESSGISEPAQVAESFDTKLSEHMYRVLKEQGELDANGALKKLHKAGDLGMSKFARLDTTVTVIDAFTIYNDFNTTDLLSDRRDDVTREDERTVSDLMVDQIEFADVIVLNKTDMVGAAQLAEVKALIKTLNREAKIVCASYGKVDVGEVVGTGMFDLAKAQTSPGWMQDLHELLIREINGKNVITPKPETEEYNVRNFVYKRRRPFHPERLWRLVYDKFILQLAHPDNAEDDGPEDRDGVTNEAQEDESADEDGDGWEDLDVDMDGTAIGSSPRSESALSDDSTVATSPASVKRRSTNETVATSADMDIDKDDDDDELATPPKEVVLSNKRSHPLLAQLFRSKGTFWLATRPDYRGVWSQAGAMLTLIGANRWDCTLWPEEVARLYPEGTDPELLKQVKHDIERGGEWGDRMQEIVFIGEKLNVEGIEELLDECLLTDEEWEGWQEGMRTVQEKQAALKQAMEDLDAAKDRLTDDFTDAFPEWEGHFQDEDRANGGDNDEDEHEGHQHP